VLNLDKSEWERYRLEDDDEDDPDKPRSTTDKIREKDISKKEGKDSIKKADLYLDSVLSRMTGTYKKSTDKIEDFKPRFKSGMTKVASTSSDTIRKAEAKGDEFTKKIFQKQILDSVLNVTVRHPTFIILFIILITIGITFYGIAPKEYGGKDFRSKIHGEFEVYLPQEHETKLILDEINKDFSTNLIIILVQTNNSKDVEDRGYADITDRDVLLDMDRLEKQIDSDMEDYGEDDGIIYVLSISVVVQVANSTPPRFQKAVHDEIEDDLGISITFRQVQGDYSIPDQEFIDRLIGQMPESSLRSMIRDTNDDGVYDTAAIIIGITNEVDQEQLVADLNHIAGEAEYSEMTVTGPIPMTLRITQRTYDEFIKVLPAAIILVGSVLILFHRNFKILIITGLPVLCSLGITYGFMGIAVDILTPQVVLIAPILIALGVAYGLYIANRYSDEKDISDPEERIKKAVKTTGRAVFLSAATTSIGFSSLIFMELIPLRVIGIGLSLGIIFCYVITILTVPSLIMALRYEKRTVMKSRERIGNVPVRNRKKIIVVALVITLVSSGMIGAGMVTANMDFIKMAPQDEEVIKKMRLYSDIFGGGQPGMILIKGRPSIGRDQGQNTNSMRDFAVLQEIEALELEINGNENTPNDEGIKNTNVLGIVDIMKMLMVPPVNLSVPDWVPVEIVDRLEDAINKSFWDVLSSDLLTSKQKQRLINIFYDSLTIELRSVFVNHDFSRSFLLVEMPAMDVVETEKAVTEVNQAIDEFQAGSSTTHLTGFAAILVAVNDMLVFNSVTSTVLALLLVFIILAFIFRSLKYSSLTLIPVALVVIWQPVLLVSIGGLGSWLDPSDPLFTGDLNLFTAIIGSIIVGIGIDFGVHMTERIRERGETVESVRHGVETSGMSFIEATATTIAGLSAVFLILIPAIQEFILLVILLLICSVLGALLILPAIYTILFRMKEARLARLNEDSGGEALEVFEEDLDKKSDLALKSNTVEKPVELPTSEKGLYGSEID
jgi:predicted RND superfamily exporter protein